MKHRVEVWRFFQRLTGQLGRPPNEVERTLLAELEESGLSAAEFEAVLEDTARWRRERGYVFRWLDQAEKSLRLAIHEHRKLEAAVPFVEALVAQGIVGGERVPGRANGVTPKVPDAAPVPAPLAHKEYVPEWESDGEGGAERAAEIVRKLSGGG